MIPPPEAGHAAADMPLPVVQLSLDGGHLVARIIDPPLAGHAHYAFYLHHNGQRVERRAYGEATMARFDHPVTAGRYTATAFVRPADPEQPPTMSRSAVLRVALDAHEPAPRPAGKALDLPAPVRIDRLADLAHLPVGEGTVQFEAVLEGLRHCVLLGETRGESLYVVLGGAVPPRNRASLPRYSRYSWRSSFPGTVMCLADPTLFLDNHLRLGWYVGDQARDATQSCVEVVRAVAQRLAVPHDRVVFWGSSGGGFAALQMAAALGGNCAALAVNAQTAILRYGIERSRSEFLGRCFPGVTASELATVYGRRLDASLPWSTARLHARAVLVQNELDRHHLRDHLVPFLDAVVGPSGEERRIRTVRYRHPSGHGAEPLTMVAHLLQELASTQVP